MLLPILLQTLACTSQHSQAAVTQQQQRTEFVCAVIKQVVETTTTEVGAVRYHYQNQQIEYQLAMVCVLLLLRA